MNRAFVLVVVVLTAAVAADGAGRAFQPTAHSAFSGVVAAKPATSPPGGFQSLAWWASWQCPPTVNASSPCLPPPGASPWNGVTMVGVFADDVQTTSPYLNTASAYNASPALFQQMVIEAHAAGKLALLTLGGSSSGDTTPWNDACSNQSVFFPALIGQMQAMGADGIDMDMEVDPHNAPWSMTSWVSCMDGLRAALNGVKTAAGKTPILNEAAVPDWQQNIAAAVQQDMSQISVDGYQYGCGNPATAAGCATTIGAELRVYTNAGIPMSKLMFGQGLDTGAGYPSASDGVAGTCGLESAYLKSVGAAGTSWWTMPSGQVNGSWPCFDATAPYIGP